MARLKVEPNTLSNTNAISFGNLNVGGGGHHGGGGTMLAAIPSASTSQNVGLAQGGQLGSGGIDCYEDVFKEITKKLYGDEQGGGGVQIQDVLDQSGVSNAQQIVYDAGDLFRQDQGGGLGGNSGGGLAIVSGPGTNGIPSGTVLVQRRLQDDKGRIWMIEGLPNNGEQIAFATLATPTGAIQTMTQSQLSQQQPPQLVQTATLQQQTQFVVAHPPQQQHQPQQQQQPPPPFGGFEERWFESDESLSWTQSKIARYNPTQKVFRCVDCDFVGFLSRVAEHWLGNHADLRVFQCPRCPYTSAWARCVRMHLTRQHGETLADNSLWKENPVLEEVTKFLTTLKTKVEMKSEPLNPNGEKRYICPCCPYQTDRRDLYNRHENIHRDEKPFQCYVCDKQFNRADHVKKHFIRIHREHPYDINKIRKVSGASKGSFLNGNKGAVKQQRPLQLQQQVRQVQVTLPQSQQQHQLLQGQYQQVTIKSESELEGMSLGEGSSNSIQVQIQQGGNQVTLQQIPHLAYFSPPVAPGQQNGPLHGIQGVGGSKKQAKAKANKKKRSSEKMYTCSYCPWQGVDNWCLKRHLNTHIKPFLCALCDYKAARSERLATHVLKVHNKRVCHKCSFLADDTESLSQHIQESHQNPLVKTGFNCNLCQEYFELRADLEAHAILEHQKVIVQCDLCDFRTTDELSMEAHLRDKHNLTPGMGAVAAAAAAAAAAAVGQGQSVNTQYQTQQPPLTEQMETTSDQTPNQRITASPQPPSSTAATDSPQVDYPPPSETPSLHISNVTGNTSTSESLSEPETLCDKCGIDFVDEDSRKLHEKRHELVNPLEDESVMESSGSKRLLRNYVCSTCSYTCGTKKLMMQHQRAHTGFELVCQAEGCMFSTPFENTLKEHIQIDHGAEEHVRCPHCGLRMPSNSAFTSHWHHHHRTICSLCVNIYRIRYDVKENDIHDVPGKAQNSSSSSTFDPYPSSSLSLFKNDSLAQSSSDFPTGLTADDALAGLGLQDTTTLHEQEPPSKKPRMELPLGGNSSTAILYKRESIRFLPRLVEVMVAPLPPRAKRKCASRKRRNKLRKPNGNNDGDGATSTPFDSPSTPRKDVNRRIDLLLRVIQEKERERRNSPVKVTPCRRYCQRGTFHWLYRNPREGYKCLSSLCENRRSWRYPRRVGLLLHKLWYHRLPRYKCDICGLQFIHMYKALLHKGVEHAEEFPPKGQSLDQIQVEQFHMDGLNEAHLVGTTPASESGQNPNNPMLS